MDFQTCYQYDPSARKRDGPVKRRKIEPLQGLQTSWPLRRSLYQRLWAKQQARLKVCLFFPFPTDQSNKTRSYYSKSTNLPSVRFLLSSKPQTLSQPLAEYLRPLFSLVQALHHMPCYFRNFPTESVKRIKVSLFLWHLAWHRISRHCSRISSRRGHLQTLSLMMRTRSIQSSQRGSEHDFWITTFNYCTTTYRRRTCLE